jgi:hypothetical protein
VDNRPTFWGWLDLQKLSILCATFFAALLAVLIFANGLLDDGPDTPTFYETVYATDARDAQRIVDDRPGCYLLDSYGDTYKLRCPVVSEGLATTATPTP